MVRDPRVVFDQALDTVSVFPEQGGLGGNDRILAARLSISLVDDQNGLRLRRRLPRSVRLHWSAPVPRPASERAGRPPRVGWPPPRRSRRSRGDRKSTRLNSSHTVISYA